MKFTFITFSVHVAVSKNGLPRSNGIKPVFTANSLLSFTLLDLFARMAGNSGIEPRGTGEDKQYRLGQPREPRDGQSVGMIGGERFQEWVREPLRFYVLLLI